MRNHADLQDLKTLIDRLSDAFRLDPELEDGLIVVYPKEDVDDTDETDVPPEVAEDLETPDPDDPEDSDKDAVDDSEAAEDDDTSGEQESLEDGSPDGDASDDDSEPEQEDSDDGDEDQDDGLTHADRIREAMQDRGWMDTDEITEAAGLESRQLFHNNRYKLDIEDRSHPEKTGTAKQYRLVGDAPEEEEAEEDVEEQPDEDDEADDPEQDALPSEEDDTDVEDDEDGYSWYTDRTPGAVLQVPDVEKYRCGSCGEECSDDQEAIDHMRDEGHRKSWDVKSRQDPADVRGS